MSEQCIKIEVDALNKESVDVLVLFIKVCNECNFDDTQLQQIIARSDEFEEGIKRLFVSLAGPSGQSLKS